VREKGREGLERRGPREGPREVGERGEWGGGKREGEREEGGRRGKRRRGKEKGQRKRREKEEVVCVCEWVLKTCSLLSWGKGPLNKAYATPPTAARLARATCSEKGVRAGPVQVWKPALPSCLVTP
jgi:hypothetical protein